MKIFKNYFLAIGFLFSLNQLSAQVDLMPPEQENYKNQLKVGVMAFVSEDRGFGLNFQYFRDFQERWAYSVAFQMRYGSGNDGAEFEDENYPYENNTQASVGGMVNYSLHPEYNFGATASGLFHFRKQNKATVFKAGTGLSLGYFNEVFISTFGGQYYVANFNPRSLDDLEKVDIIAQDYNRFFDIGWMLELDYQYYLSNRVFVGLSGNLQNFFASGTVAFGFSLDFGVNF